MALGLYLSAVLSNHKGIINIEFHEMLLTNSIKGTIDLDTLRSIESLFACYLLAGSTGAVAIDYICSWPS